MKIAIIVPCYNEGKRLEINKFNDYLLCNDHIHFIFVDDGSTDNTSFIINDLKSKFNNHVSLLKNITNKGKAESVRLGVQKSYKINPDFIGFLDADLAAPIEEIDKLLSVVKSNSKKEIVFASRIQLVGNVVKKNFFRYLMGRVFATCVALLLKIPTYDTQCGAKIFSKRICEIIFNKPFISPWLFDIELFARLINHFGLEKTIAISFEQPVSEWIDKDGSKVNPTYFLKAPLELFKIIRHYKISK